MADFAAVVVDAPLTTLYHYRIPQQLRGVVVPGSVLTVPFGRRKLFGFCVEVSEACPIAESRLKEIVSSCPPEEAAPADVMALTKWAAAYYRAGWGQALAAAVPAGLRKGKGVRSQLLVSLADAERARAELPRLGRRAKKQAAELEYLLEALAAGRESVPAAEVEQACGATRAALKGLEKLGLAEFSGVPVHRELATLREQRREIELNPGQQAALAELVAAVDARSFRPFLLHGVTGSGKTEVYLRAMSHALEAGRGALVLVPEISLTPQTVERFRRAAGKLAVLHSGMSDGERAESWRAMRRGEVRVAVGARSAVFAPVAELGLVIVDEEHEGAFKQDNAPRYHARDAAVVRARECGATAVLGSATPSLESWQNALSGKYRLLTLSERAGGARPPAAVAVDMRREWAETKGTPLLSRELERALAATLERREQAILLLNRRGFNTYVHCLGCGSVMQCDNCDISLTYHRRSGLLRCHYCDFSRPAPEKCPSCGAAALRFTGSGTERAEGIVAARFPQARVLRMDSDTMSGRDAHAEALSAFARGEYDILLGTQMVAKGFDFPNVTLAGVLLADGAINLPDFRAAEKTFQLITQASGRAGRAGKPGRAVIQAFEPEHYAIRCALRQDFPAFAARELEERRALRYPPFGRLCRVVVRGKDGAKARRAAAEIAAALAAAAPGAALGPAPCAVAATHGEERHQVLLKCATHAQLAKALQAAAGALRDGGGVSVAVDVDPVSML